MGVTATHRPWAMGVLRAAADAALRRGGADAAARYLRRALLESSAGDGERAHLLIELAKAERGTDPPPANATSARPSGCCRRPPTGRPPPCSSRPVSSARPPPRPSTSCATSPRTSSPPGLTKGPPVRSRCAWKRACGTPGKRTRRSWPGRWTACARSAPRPLGDQRRPRTGGRPDQRGGPVRRPAGT
ncbi:hypothetical protein O1L55_31850 [Streptomyces albulus]|nr:hypothetical protein [Streptomyces noursei]